MNIFRYVDAILTHKLLIALPLFIVPLLSVIGAMLLARPYQVTATIWVESSPLLNISDRGSGYQQPSEVQAGALNEWFGTRSFVREVIDRAGLSEEIVQNRWPKPSGLEAYLTNLPLLGRIARDVLFRQSRNPDARLDQAVAAVRKAVKADAEGPHLVKVSYKGDDGQLGARLVAETIALFTERTKGQTAEQTKAAVMLFQSQLADFEARLKRSADALQNFKQSHPAVPNSERPPAEDQQLAALESQYAIDRNLYENAQSRLEQARLAGAADLQKVQSGFQVADPPEASAAAGNAGGKGLIMFVVVGLAFGLVLGMGTVLVTVWVQSPVASADDIAAITAVPVIAVVPELTVPTNDREGKRTPKRKVRGFLGAVLAGEAGALRRTDL